MEQSLYNITAEHRYLCAMLEESGGELTPEMEKALTINKEQLTVKAETYAEIINKYLNLAAIAKARKEQMAKAQATAERIAQIFKERLRDAMVETDTSKIESGVYRLFLRSTKAVVVDDEAVLPNHCRVVKTTPDKKAIKEAIERGEEVRGAHLQENKSLIIK